MSYGRKTAGEEGRKKEGRDQGVRKCNEVIMREEKKVESTKMDG